MKSHYRRINWEKIAFSRQLSIEMQEHIIDQFENALIKTEKIDSPDENPRYLLKTSKAGRAVCTTIKQDDGSDCLLVLGADENHKVEDLSIMKKGAIDKLYDFSGQGAFTSSDKLLVYSRQQSEAINSFDTLKNVEAIDYHIINGLAGSGKTSIAMDILSKASKEGIDSLYLSKSSRLVGQAEKELSIEQETIEEGEAGPADFDDIYIPTKCITYKDFATNLSELHDSKYIGEVGIGNFQKWFLNSKDASIKSLKSKISEVPTEELYIEIQKAYFEAGRKSSAYPHLHSGKDNIAKTILDSYIRYLKDEKLLDVSFISLLKEASDPHHEDEIQQKKVIVIDEAQNFTPLELKEIVDNAGKESIIYICRDGNQSIIDPFDLTLQTMYKLTGKEPEFIHNLSISYRTPPSITDMANRVLEVKAHVIGGKLHKIDSSSKDQDDDIFSSNAPNEGYVRHLINKDDKDIGPLKEASKNITKCAVIVFSDGDKEKAESEFPEAIIMKPDEVLGLEYEKVILFRPFDKKGALGDSDIFKTEYSASKPIPSNFPKNTDNLKYVIPFNEFFVALTRSTSDLYIWDIDAKGPGSRFFQGVFEGLSQEYDAEKAARLSEMTLEDILKYIKENQHTFKPNILEKYISKAFDMINDAGDLKSNLKQLKFLLNLLEETGLEKSELSGKISAKIDEAKSLKGEKSDSTDVSSGSSSPILSGGKKPDLSDPRTSSSSPESVKSEHIKKPKKKKKKEKAQVKAESADTIPVKKEEVKSKSKDFKKIEKLCDAIYRDNILLVRKLIKQGADLNVQNKNGHSPAYLAVARNNIEMLELLLDSGADASIPTLDGTTVLHIAGACNQLDIVKLLINKGKVNINAITDYSGTALSDSAREGNIEVVKFLLSKGANISIKSAEGKTAMDIASDMGKTEIYEILKTQSLLNKNLFQAIGTGNEMLIKLFVERGADVNCTNKKGETLIMIAAQCRVSEETMNILLDAGADPTIVIEDGSSPFMHLCANGYTKIAAKILKANKIDINAQDKIGDTALSYAASKGFVETARFLLDEGGDPKIVNSQGFQAIHKAIFGGHFPIVELLIKSGKVDVNDQDVVTGVTPLNLEAIKYSNGASDKVTSEKVMQFLLDSGADPTIFDKSGINAFIMLCHYGFTRIIQNILETRDINLDASDSNKCTALSYAADAGHEEIVKILLKAGADPKTFDQHGYQPLHKASLEGHTSIVKLLLDSGKVDIDAQDNDGYTALCTALGKGNIDVAEFLLEAGADPSVIPNNNQTPLMYAVRFCNDKIVKSILDIEKANINHQDKDGFTALHWAVQYGEYESACLLLDAGADARIKNNNHTNPMTLAEIFRRRDIVELIKEKSGIDSWLEISHNTDFIKHEFEAETKVAGDIETFDLHLD